MSDIEQRYMDEAGDLLRYPFSTFMQSQARIAAALHAAEKRGREEERERCAAEADAAHVEIEKQAAIAEDPRIHDALLMAADFMQLLAAAIRQPSTGDER